MVATERSAPDGRRALQALSSAALALPAYAAAPPAQTSLDYHFFAYREADLDRGKAAGTQRGRYEIDGHKLQAEAPLGSRYGLRADLTVESMSGASPWWVSPDADGKPVQVLSGATIQDDREDLALSLTRYDERRSLSLSLGHSSEDDYRANYLGLSAGFEPAGAQYSYDLGVSLSDDRLQPTDGGSERFPDRIVSADKRQWRLQGSLTQILTRASQLQWGASYTRLSGHLSDPYKLVFVDSELLPDTRPRERRLGAWFLRWRRHFKQWAAALHLDYRGTQDDWDISTTTLSTRWVQRFGDNWRVSGGLRYYSQSQAEFYAPFLDEQPRDGLMSSDYRLAPYGALSLMAQVNYQWRGLDLGFGLEHYDADGALALGNVRLENPGLLRFQLLNLRLAYRFD